MSRIVIKYNRFAEIAAKLPVAVGAIVEKSARDVEAAAKEVVPVDTGNLKNSITTEMDGDGMRGVVAAGAEYAKWVEFGTGRMAAQPYMTPAAEKVRGPFLMAMSRLEDGLK